MSRNKNNNWIIFLSLLVILAFLPISYRQFANALTGNYSKVTGDQLTITDWNNLDNDFVAKSGDTMAGALNMNNNLIQNLSNPVAPNDAVNLATLNSRLVAGKKIVCGETTSGSTNWVQWGTSQVTIYVSINTSSAGFTSEPTYLTSLGGAGNHFNTVGGLSVYNTTATGFTVYITKLNTPSTSGTNIQVDLVSPTMANTWGWHVHWCGIGN